jgi:hypothetical protein
MQTNHKDHKVRKEKRMRKNAEFPAPVAESRPCHDAREYECNQLQSTAIESTIINGARMYNKILRSNLNKIHTTELGIIRIKSNLKLETNDVVEWCIDKIKNADCSINKIGKNYYAKIDGSVITINAHSYTIITAHEEKK